MNWTVEYVPGHTPLHRLDPRAKIGFLLLATVMIVVVQNLWVAGGVLLTLLALWLIARLPLSVIKGLGQALVGIILFLLAAQALLYPGETALVQPIIPQTVPWIGGLGRITLEGLSFGLLLSLRLLAMVTLMPLVSMTTPVHTLTLGLVRLGLPYSWAYMTTTALNLIPILQTEAVTIADAQRLRAFRVFEQGRLWDKLKAYPALVTPLIIGAMRRAQLVAVAMDSRAFGASAERTYIQDIQMRARDWAFLVGATVYVGAAIAANYLLG